MDVKNDEIKKKTKKKRSLEKDTRGMRSLTQLTGWILHETRVLQPVQINQSFSRCDSRPAYSQLKMENDEKFPDALSGSDPQAIVAPNES